MPKPGQGDMRGDTGGVDHQAPQLLAYYKNRVEEFEKERAEMVESVHRCSVQAAETHRLEWENRQRADEIRELQKALSDAHAFLFEERQRLLALQAENDELRLQELEDRKRIQQLLAGSDSKARQQASSYSVEALLLKIESLQAQLQEHKQLGNERVAALVEDRRIREAEEVAHRSHCNQQLEQLASKLGKVEEQLRLTTCDFIRARRDKQAAEETIASLETALAQERQRAAEEFNSLRKASDSELRETRSTLEGKLEAITSNLRKQLKAKEEELINLSSMHTHAAASADERVAELEAKISRLTAANKQLEVRRFQDQEGWSADVTSLRKQLTAIDRRLHEMRLADRLDDEDRLEAIIHGLRRRAPEALSAPAQGLKGQKPRVASGKPGSKGGGGGGGDDVHAGKDVHGGKDGVAGGLQEMRARILELEARLIAKRKGS
ncbi:centriole proteome protein [Haematococcus lacustris]